MLCAAAELDERAREITADMLVHGRIAKLVDLRDDSMQIVRLVENVSDQVDDGLLRVSVKSPLGEALVNRRVGETVQVHAPAGDVSYRIVHVE